MSKKPSVFPELIKLAKDQLKTLRIPGAALGLYYQGKEWTAGLGITNLEHPLSVTPDALFQIGSITKPIVATALLHLENQGWLELDAPIRRYLPALRLADEEVARRVTLRHLLTHTAGWVGDYFNDFGPGPEALTIMVQKLAELPQLTPLGEIYSYNNAGFYLAGRVIEVITGQTFETAIADLVLRPLGMDMSFFFAEDMITHRIAVGHEIVNDELRVARPWALGRAAYPAGGLISTVRDLLKFARFQLGEGRNAAGEEILSAQSLRLMQTPLFPSTGLNWIGLTWRITQLENLHLVSHGGATNGQESLLLFVPDADFAFVVLTNSDRGDIFCQNLSNLALQNCLGQSWPQTEPISVAEVELQPYVGRYDSAMALQEICLEGGQLVLHTHPKGHFPTPDSPAAPAPPPTRLAFYAPDRVVALDPPLVNQRGEFLRTAEGDIAWFRFSGRVHRRLN